MNELKDKKIVIFVEEIYNEHEFWYPKIRLEEAGAKVITAGTEAGKTYRSKVGMPAVADTSFASLNADEIDGLVIPGGFAPDFMRRSKDCLNFVRSMHEKGKLVAFICHAGWVVISAGIVKGKKATCYSSIKDDLVNAGAIWHDAAVVQDGNLISSRSPADLPDFMRAIIAFLQK